MIKKIFFNFIKMILIISPIIIFCIDFCVTFWGVDYELNVDQTNITVIEENLQKDNIKVENLNDVKKIEISGAGLNDYSDLSFHYKDNSIKSVNLYNKQAYYIEQYLSKHHKFNYDDMFEISIFISLTTMVVTYICGKKKWQTIKNSNLLRIQE